jgi:hypothetical protein
MGLVRATRWICVGVGAFAIVAQIGCRTGRPRPGQENATPERKATSNLPVAPRDGGNDADTARRRSDLVVAARGYNRPVLFDLDGGMVLVGPALLVVRDGKVEFDARTAFSLTESELEGFGEPDGGIDWITGRWPDAVFLKWTVSEASTGSDAPDRTGVRRLNGGEWKPSGPPPGNPVHGWKDGSLIGLRRAANIATLSLAGGNGTAPQIDRRMCAVDMRSLPGGEVFVFGRDCQRGTALVERWDGRDEAGHIDDLRSLARPDRAVPWDTCMAGPSAVYFVAGGALLGFDGSTWSALDVPTALPVSSVGCHSDGTVAVVASNRAWPRKGTPRYYEPPDIKPRGKDTRLRGEVWRRRPGEAWERLGLPRDEMFPNTVRVDGERHVIVAGVDSSAGQYPDHRPRPYVVLTTADQVIPTSLDGDSDNAPPAPVNDECQTAFVEIGTIAPDAPPDADYGPLREMAAGAVLEAQAGNVDSTIELIEVASAGHRTVGMRFGQYHAARPMIWKIAEALARRLDGTSPPVQCIEHLVRRRLIVTVPTGKVIEIHGRWPDWF